MSIHIHPRRERSKDKGGGSAMHGLLGGSAEPGIPQGEGQRVRRNEAKALPPG